MRVHRRQRALDLVIVAAVVALGAVALADALHDGTRGAPTTPTTSEGGAPKLAGVDAPGLIAVTLPGACELRAFDVRSGRMLELPGLETSCELLAPRFGTRIAYGVPGDGGATRRFRILDLRRPGTVSGEYVTVAPFAWSPDGSALAWCDGPRSGFERSFGQRPERLDHCPRAYDPSGATASVDERHRIVIRGRPLLKVRGSVWELAWGVDGSLAVLVDGGRIDRYVRGRLAGAASLRHSTLEQPLTLAPDNCAALAVGSGIVRLVDLGCFEGRTARIFDGVYADWSPDGEWIAVAEPDAVVFHRVVGDEASVRWNLAVGQLVWLGG